MKAYVTDLVALICVAIFAMHYTKSAWITIAAALFTAVYGAWNFYDGLCRGSPARLLMMKEKK